MINFVFGVLVGSLIMAFLLEVTYSRFIQNLKDRIYFLEREIKRLKEIVESLKDE